MILKLSALIVLSICLTIFLALPSEAMISFIRRICQCHRYFTAQSTHLALHFISFPWTAIMLITYVQHSHRHLLFNEVVIFLVRLIRQQQHHRHLPALEIEWKILLIICVCVLLCQREWRLSCWVFSIFQYYLCTKHRWWKM